MEEEKEKEEKEKAIVRSAPDGSDNNLFEKIYLKQITIFAIVVIIITMIVYCSAKANTC